MANDCLSRRKRANVTAQIVFLSSHVVYLYDLLQIAFHVESNYKILAFAIENKDILQIMAIDIDSCFEGVILDENGIYSPLIMGKLTLYFTASNRTITTVTPHTIALESCGKCIM